tara:strand:- start:424 stop:2169 length:1746 start_codon:yes stop_codon:yes gene_type:complete
MAASGKPLVLTLKSDGNYTLAEALDIDVSAISTDVLTKFNNSLIDIQASANSIGLSATVLEATNTIVSAGVDIATLFGGVDTTGTTEAIQDIAGTMTAGGTQTGITVTYQDAAGNVDFVVDPVNVGADSGTTQNITPGQTLGVCGAGGTTTAMAAGKVTITTTNYAVGNQGLTDVDFTASAHSKLHAIEAAADVTDATNVTNAGAVMKSFSTTAGMDFVLDQDDFSSNSATKLATQQSIKAYVTTETTGITITTDSGSLYKAPGDTLTITGGDGQTCQVDGGNITFVQETLGDGENFNFGSGGDSGISFDGTDTNWHLQQVGTGDLNVSGGINMKTGGDLNVTGSLDVYDTQRDIALFHNNTATATIGVESTTTSATLTASGVHTLLENTADGNIVFRTSGDRVMTMEPGGKVGINTLDPGQFLDVVDDTAGAGVSVRVEHKNTDNAGSDARFIAKVAHANGGDPHMRFMIQSGQSWCIGLANAASDNFRIADANNLDSNVALEIDTSQNVWMAKTLAIGQEAAADNAAILELVSTTKAFLPPKMTTSQRNLISGAAGLTIYNTTTNKLQCHNGSGWQDCF